MKLSAYVTRPGDVKAQKAVEHVYSMWEAGPFTFIFMLCGIGALLGDFEGGVKLLGVIFGLPALTNFFYSGVYMSYMSHRANRMIRSGRILEVEPHIMKWITPHISQEMTTIWGGYEGAMGQVYSALSSAINSYASQAVKLSRARASSAVISRANGDLHDGFSLELKKIFGNLQYTAVQLMQSNETNILAESYGYKFVRE